MAISDLTIKQREVLAYLDKKVHPTDIAKKMGISRNGVYQHMKRIREAGVEYPAVKVKRAGRPKASGKKPVGRPKGSGKKPVGRPKGSGKAKPKPLPQIQSSEPVTRSAGGERSIEDSIKAELETCLNRATDIEDQVDKLGIEKVELLDRARKLKGASEALAS